MDVFTARLRTGYREQCLLRPIPQFLDSCAWNVQLKYREPGVWTSISAVWI